MSESPTQLVLVAWSFSIDRRMKMTCRFRIVVASRTTVRFIVPCQL